jgi:predicted transcriptional regulator
LPPSFPVSPHPSLFFFNLPLTSCKNVYIIYNAYNIYKGGIFMKTDTISARLNPETAKKLELLVKATARSRSYLVAEAIEAYVEEQAWQIGAIREGIKEADKGKFATDQEVRKTFKKWGLNEG